MSLTGPPPAASLAGDDAVVSLWAKLAQWLGRKAMFLGKLSVLIYFFAVSIATLYLTCTLWMTDPKELPAASALERPACPEKGGALPQITGMAPQTVSIGENYVGLTIVGCYFGERPKVRFNGVEKEAFPAGSNQLMVPFVASDFGGSPTIAVTVEAETASKAAEGQPPVARRSDARTIRIAPAGEVKVVWSYLRQRRDISVELRLILLVVLVGAFAACIFGLNSFVNYAGEQKLSANWMWLYFARPLLGAGIAFVFYLVIRGGFLAGTNVDAKAVNPFGFVAVAALVGMFSDAALMKLNEVFDTLFRAKDTRKEGLDALVIDVGDALPAGNIGAPYRYELKVKNGRAPYRWTKASAFPPGLDLSDAGVIAGTPIAVADTKVTVQVTDDDGKTAKKELRLTIAT